MSCSLPCAPQPSVWRKKASEIKEDMATYREKAERKRETATKRRIGMTSIWRSWMPQKHPTTEEAPESRRGSTLLRAREAVEPISPEMNKYLNKSGRMFWTA